MKTFETPVVDVKKFDVVDVLTVSSEPSEPVEESSEIELPPFFGELCMS